MPTNYGDTATQRHVDNAVAGHMSKSMRSIGNGMGAKQMANGGHEQKDKMNDAKAKAYAQGILDTIYSQQVTGLGAGTQDQGGGPQMPFTRGLSDALGAPTALPVPPTPPGPPPMPPGPPGVPPMGMPPGPPPPLGGPPGMAPGGPLPPGLAPSPGIAQGPLGVFSPNALLRQRIPR